MYDPAPWVATSVYAWPNTLRENKKQKQRTVSCFGKKQGVILIVIAKKYMDMILTYNILIDNSLWVKMTPY